MTRSALRLAWLGGILGCLLVVGAAAAQDLGSARVQEALDATDRRIELAATLVGEASSPQAVTELGLARDLQARARSAFAAGQLAIAARLTLEARDHADRAVAIVRGLPDPDRVALQVERTRDVLDHVRDRLEGCDQPRARALLGVSLAMQERAESAFGDSRYLAALQLTLSARERAFKAMRRCNLEESVQESAARALQRTADVIARAREAVGDAAPEPARAALARAEALQSDAQGEYRAQRWDAALRLTQSARLLALRILRPAGAPPPGGRPRP